MVAAFVTNRHTYSILHRNLQMVVNVLHCQQSRGTAVLQLLMADKLG